MATINLSANNDVIIPTNDDTTYRGLSGDDTYILVSQEESSSISIIDTEGSNVIQLPEWSKIKSIVVAKTALKITCDDMTVFTINGADKFSYDIGGNLTSNSTGSIKTFTEFVDIFELTAPSTGTVNKSTNKIVYEDSFRILYEVKVQKEDNGNKFYLNGELSPDLSLSSGEKYVFDLNDASASNHPLSISETKNGIHADGATVTNGIKFYAQGYEKTETNFSSLFSPEGTLENAFMVFEPSVNDTVLYYYCLFHNGMANDAKIIIDNYVEKIPEAVATSISVQNVGASDYNFTVKGVQANDPTLTLERGKTYEFDVSAQGHPFWIKTDQINGSSSQYNEGITNNGLSSGKLIFTVPTDAPSTLYYICQIHSSMTGVIKIVDNNESGIILENNTSNSDTSTSTPSYGGYNYDFDLISSSSDIGQIITPSFDI
jgi:hypothetical protein|tara:strand:- start:660 stop:1955 length:1296 start_codon:yes stop_codon:yes gene_type:complete